MTQPQYMTTFFKYNINNLKMRQQKRARRPRGRGNRQGEGENERDDYNRGDRLYGDDTRVHRVYKEGRKWILNLSDLCNEAWIFYVTFAHIHISLLLLLLRGK